MSTKVNIKINDKKLLHKIDQLVDDDVMLEVHNIFARMCDPYVPMESGDLAQTTEITPEYVRYTQPYAHYQYTGLVYGPNIPITENGMIVGWFSRPGETKTPTGEELNYNTEMHPLATKEWDKAMLGDHKDSFIQQIEDVLKARMK